MAAAESHYTSLSDGLPLSPLRYTDFAPSPSATDVRALEIERRKRGIGLLSPLSILGGTLAAGVFAVAHHLFDAHLDARAVSGTWTQAGSSRVEIFFATAFKILFCFSAGVSVCQLSWYSLRHTPSTLADLDVLIGPPSPWILQRLNLITRMPIIIACTAVILASPLITILAPSLHTRQAPTAFRAISVPTLNTTTDAPLNDLYIAAFGGIYGMLTQTWDKTALIAILSDGPVGWPMPQGCAPECTYSIEYIAPAVRCTDLQPDQIDDKVEPEYRFVPRVFQDPPSAYLQGYDALSSGSGYGNSPLNFTVQNDATNATDRYTWTVAYLPFLASTVRAGALVNASGSVCTFYNATHAVSTHYFNGTQESHVSVVALHEPLNTTYRRGYPAVDISAPDTKRHYHLLAMADSISAHLAGSVVIDGHFGTVAATTLLMESNIFEPYDVDSLTETQGQIFGLNTTAGVTNVSQALQDLVANITLGFMHLNTGSTIAEATVTSTDIVYIYDRTTLIATYAAAALLLLLISGVGMFALLKNGEANANTFSRLLVVLRNPELDAVANAVDAWPWSGERDVDPRRVRLRLVEADRGGGVVFRVTEHGQAAGEKVT